MSATKEPNDVLKEAEDVAERRDAEHDMTEKAEDRDWSFFQTDWDELAFWIQTGRVDEGITKHGTKRLMAVFQEAYDNQGRDAQFTLAGMIRVLALMKTLMDKKFGESDYDEVYGKEGS